jgi:hypothetical protein
MVWSVVEKPDHRMVKLMGRLGLLEKKAIDAQPGGDL